MKRIRMPAISATIGATAMPRIMEVSWNVADQEFSNLPGKRSAGFEDRDSPVHGNQLPAPGGRLAAQHEAAAVTDAHFEKLVGQIGPAIEHGRHRQATLREGKNARDAFG